MTRRVSVRLGKRMRSFTDLDDLALYELALTLWDWIKMTKKRWFRDNFERPLGNQHFRNHKRTTTNPNPNKYMRRNIYYHDVVARKLNYLEILIIRPCQISHIRTNRRVCYSKIEFAIVTVSSKNHFFHGTSLKKILRRIPILLLNVSRGLDFESACW